MIYFVKVDILGNPVSDVIYYMGSDNLVKTDRRFKKNRYNHHTMSLKEPVDDYGIRIMEVVR